VKGGGFKGFKTGKVLNFPISFNKGKPLLREPPDFFFFGKYFGGESFWGPMC